jgi:hypothetical protein
MDSPHGLSLGKDAGKFEAKSAKCRGPSVHAVHKQRLGSVADSPTVVFESEFEAGTFGRGSGPRTSHPVGISDHPRRLTGRHRQFCSAVGHRPLQLCVIEGLEAVVVEGVKSDLETSGGEVTDQIHLKTQLRRIGASEFSKTRDDGVSSLRRHEHDTFRDLT